MRQPVEPGVVQAEVQGELGEELAEQAAEVAAGDDPEGLEEAALLQVRWLTATPAPPADCFEPLGSLRLKERKKGKMKG